MRSTGRLTPDQLRELRYYVTWFLVASVVFVLALPVVLLVVFSLLTPSYMAPMFHDPLGVLLLGVAAVVEVAGGGATLLAVRRLRAGKPQPVTVLILVVTFLFAFPALWLVLLGPALVTISQGT
jgi:drug/metabolite transporter (DMT)-like permease